MKTTESRHYSIIATFVSILLAVVLVAMGCAPRVVGTRQVPDGNNMATMIKNGATPYKDDVPAIALAGTGAYTTNFSATLKVTDVTNTRMIIGETTSLITSAGQEPRHASVVLYLCQPLSEKADKFSNGTIAYGGTGYPKIIEGQTYTVSGILQPHWQGIPLVYVPTANEFKQTMGDESFIGAPSGAFESDQTVSTLVANDKVVAKVNKEPILLSLVSSSYLISRIVYDVQTAHLGDESAVSADLAAAKPDPEKSLNQLIDDSLLVQEAERQGVKADSKWLDTMTTEQKTWFHSLLHPETITDNLDPMSRDEINKLGAYMQDMVEASGLSETAYFDQIMRPYIEGGAKINALAAKLKQENPKLTTVQMAADLRGGASIEIIDNAAVLALAQEKP